MPRPDFLAALILLALPASADPLPDMAGPWVGSGWARQIAGGPQEAVRCQIDNTFDPSAVRLSIKGRCAVPGRRFDIDGALIAQDNGRVRGHWSNPDGPGRTAISGQIDGDAVHFTFRATDPASGTDVSQVSTWRLDGDVLSFLSVIRSDCDPMSSIEFHRR